uniref:Uncharacterized protein n=1 Tax=Anguilla anguilla TaxID=7936 RepID=A0A0E9QS30_ANGAN
MNMVHDRQSLNITAKKKFLQVVSLCQFIMNQYLLDTCVVISLNEAVVSAERENI